MDWSATVPVATVGLERNRPGCDRGTGAQPSRLRPLKRVNFKSKRDATTGAQPSRLRPLERENVKSKRDACASVRKPENHGQETAKEGSR